LSYKRFANFGYILILNLDVAFLDDVTYSPGSSDEGHLPRGLWTVQYETFGDGEPCGLRVDAQSTLQVYRNFDSSNTSDDGFGQATINFGIFNLSN
jgi:hypothetical protein